MKKAEHMKKELFILVLIGVIVFFLYMRASGSNKVVIIDAGHGGLSNTFYYYNSSIYSGNPFWLMQLNTSSGREYYIQDFKHSENKSAWIYKGDSGANTFIKGNTLYEKDINLAISEKLFFFLSPFYHTLKTRSSDSYIPLEERRKLSEANNASLFISIHQNSIEGDCSARNYSEVYYNNPSLKPLALDIINSFNGSFGFYGKIEETKKYLVLNTNRNAILVEVNYLCNEKAAVFLSNVENQERIAKFLSLSIRKHLK